jgi:hypothetical protein
MAFIVRTNLKNSYENKLWSHRFEAIFIWVALCYQDKEAKKFFHASGLTFLRFCLFLLFNNKSLDRPLHRAYMGVGGVAILKRRPTYRREHKASLLKCCFVVSAHRQSEFG